MELLDPNLSYEEFSDERLLQEFNAPTPHSKGILYPLMAKRADTNFVIRNLLFSVILDDQARKRIEIGVMAHSWFPAIFILKHSNSDVKRQLKEVLQKWSQDEKELFLIHIRREKEFYDLLKDIV